MSSPPEALEKAPKGSDFLSRIPPGNRLQIPGINSSYQEKLYRTVALLGKNSPRIKKARANALYFIGLNDWASTRELEQRLQQAVAKIPASRTCLELADIADAEKIAQLQKRHGCDIYGFSQRLIALKH
jgi:hypothetical protein